MMQPWIETENLKAYFRLGSAPYALITFNSLGFRPDEEDFWASPVVRKLDIGCVGVVAKRPNWFPAKDIEEIARRVRGVLSDYREVLAYGNSMGAYAALAHGKTLGATTTLAFSPQFSLDPALVPHDKRYQEFFRQDLNGGEAVRSLPGRSIIVYDPYQPLDREHVELIRKVGRIEEVHAPFMDHDTIHMVASSETAKVMFRAALDGDLRALRRLLKPLRRKVPIYYRSIAYRGLVIRKSPFWTSVGLRNGLQLFPQDEVLQGWSAKAN